jgi:hypothetical protein
MEVLFVLFFMQWYASRYFYLGGQLPFAALVALILGSWGAILGIGLWRDKHRVGIPSQRHSPVDKRSSPTGKSRA